ncbi:hypothetical protein [Enterobacter hormaechei]|nr:hypothetical protein [Enterobacter hormaechei]
MHHFFIPLVVDEKFLPHIFSIVKITTKNQDADHTFSK